MTLSDEDREHAWNLGASLPVTEAHLDLLEEIAVSAPRQPREQRPASDDAAVRRAS